MLTDLTYQPARYLYMQSSRSMRSLCIFLDVIISFCLFSYSHLVSAGDTFWHRNRAHVSATVAALRQDFHLILLGIIDAME